eukprot:EG_transcript_24635
MRLLPVLLLWLTIIDLYFSAAETSLLECTPLPRKLCPNCTAEDRDKALAACGSPIGVTLRPLPGGGGLAVHYMELNDGRLGNQLARFFTARALALLGNFAIGNGTISSDHLHLSLNNPPLPKLYGFTRVEEMALLCRNCSLTQTFPNRCPGLWLAADIRQYLTHTFRQHGRLRTAPDIAIQFRCSDSHAFDRMGLFSFGFYHRVLAPHISRESRISILPDISGFESPCCSALALALAEALRAVFRCAVELLVPSTAPEDFAYFT